MIFENTINDLLEGKPLSMDISKCWQCEHFDRKNTWCDHHNEEVDGNAFCKHHTDMK